MEIETLDYSTNKLRGGYYTPSLIADFLCKWAIRNARDKILEPSCGDGVLVKAAAEHLLRIGASTSQVAKQLKATELYESEAIKAINSLDSLGVNGSDCIYATDFFTAIGSTNQIEFFETDAPLKNIEFDVVVGNPPFLRYHNFPEEQRSKAFDEMRSMGLNPSRLTNIWVPFLIAASKRLTANGRLAMVIPSELLQVGYAGETRSFLARYFSAITIVTFRKLVFPGIQQEVVLLLAEKGNSAVHKINIIEIDNADDLKDCITNVQHTNAHKPLTETKDKWTLYFLNPIEIELLHKLERYNNLPRLGTFAFTEVGVVTGNNLFFVQNETSIKSRNLQAFAKPLVGRTSQLKGLIYTDSDHDFQRENGTTCWLIDIPKGELPNSVVQFIKEGELENIHKGYKCSIRPNWYTVPSIWSPDAFLFRQIYKAPKIVANLTKAISTDTIHRVRMKQDVDVSQFAASFYNVLTFAFAEVLGRSYGGGVLEIEPREAGNLPIPFSTQQHLDIEMLDKLERDGKEKEILSITNNLIRDVVGIDKSDITKLTSIWQKLSGRRLNRKAARKTI